jgi:hypothetical protein
MTESLLEMLVASFAVSAGASVADGFDIARALLDLHELRAGAAPPNIAQCRILAAEATLYGQAS